MKTTKNGIFEMEIRNGYRPHRYVNVYDRDGNLL